MRRRMIGRRAAALALACLLMSAATAFADTVPADGDDVAMGNQGFIDLETLIAGETVEHSVTFSLTCVGLNHAVAGQTIGIALSSVTRPLDGVASATPTTIGPVPADWPPSGAGCPSPAPVLPATGPSVVSLTMPTTPGDDYIFTLMWSRVGATGLTGISAVSFQVDVIPNTPPSLVLPGDLTAEASAASGAVVTYAATALDAEDDPDPTPSCSPASGSTFPLGTTTVSCTVADRIGATATGSFVVTVADTTPPDLALPADQTVEATSPSGAVATWAATATDLVDGDVAVACLPALGATFALGPTQVDCSTVDAAGNGRTGSFGVTVVDIAAPTLSGVPAGLDLTTSDEGGATLDFALPTATDVADPSPTVACTPAPGATIPVGTTSVTCTATDDAGNSVAASFDATVTFVSGVEWTATWLEPIGGTTPALSANHGRTVPVKVEIFADGVEQASGAARLSVAPCAGGAAVDAALSREGSDRWAGHLDTARLAGPGCYTVTASLDGHDAGSFRLDLRGDDPTPTSKPPRGRRA